MYRSINLLGPPTGKYCKIEQNYQNKGKGYLLSVKCSKMQGYENVIRMHLSVFLLELGGGGYMESLTANQLPNLGIRALIPGVGNYDTSSGNFFIKLYNQFDDPSKGF